MKKFLPAFCVVMMLLAGCDTTVTKQEMASVDYGPRPEHWKEEIRGYLGIRLTDPTAAIVDFRNEPQQLFQKKTLVREQQWGWAVCVWVNDKNRAGAFDGFYPMSFVLRNDKIVAVNGGPDDANVIGARYAHEQCAQLGAPFIQLR
jgi:hypothetical protein